MSKKLCQVFKDLSIYFSNIQKRNDQKIVLIFLSILFLIFEKRDKKKNCARYFEILKYTFLIFEKGISKKLC